MPSWTGSGVNRHRACKVPSGGTPFRSRSGDAAGSQKIRGAGWRPFVVFVLNRLLGAGLGILQPVTQSVGLLRNWFACRGRRDPLRLDRAGHATVGVRSGMHLVATRRAEAGIVADRAASAADLWRWRDLDAGPGRPLRLAGLRLRQVDDIAGTADVRIALDQLEQFGVERYHIVFRQRGAAQGAADLLGLVDLEVPRTDAWYLPSAIFAVGSVPCQLRPPEQVSL